MLSDAVAVATMTWARTPEEEEVLTRALGTLAASGLPIAIADRLARPTFSATLAALHGARCVEVVAPGLVAQVKAAIERALAFSRPLVLYVEPDKELFFAGAMAPFLERALAHREGGFVLAARSASSFRTFPPMQRCTERMINRLCAASFNVPGDYSYGPFLMDRQLAAHVLTLPDTLGWGWRHALFLAAHRRGLRIVHDVADLPCPPDQQVESAADRAHRLRQLSQNVLGLVDTTAAAVPSGP